MFLLVCLAAAVYGYRMFELPLIVERQRSEGNQAFRLDAALGIREFSFVMEENGPGYALNFSGLAGDSLVYGILEDFELEIFRQGDRCLVRPAAGAKEWDDVDKAGLSDLRSLVYHPLEMLDTILREHNVQIERGADRYLDEKLCQTFLLRVFPPDLRLFPRFNAASEACLEQLQVYLWLGKEDIYPYKVAFLLDVAVDGEKARITRVFHLDAPKEKALPLDLPLYQGEESLI